MAPRTIRMTLPSNPKSIKRVEGFIHKIGKHAHLDEIQTNKLMVSLTEAVNNAILHGNKADAKKKVAVVCLCLPDELVITIADEGKGFKLSNVKNPLEDENLLRTSGRGIFLMRTLMDRVEYEIDKKGSTVTLVLELRK
ncbi:MAG: ATP-binding protein [Bacteroidetes bacterium]|nr:ATP-binding protein [Bacteroidota bacterium]MCW5895588.1 ATP-binding protein [Bacteroidota bacterium]